MNLKNLTLPELAETLKELHEPSFRAKQVYGWLHKGVRSYEEMTNLPKTLREKLAENHPIQPPSGGPQAGVSKGRHHQVSVAAF